MSEIEAAVEEIKRAALPRLEAELLKEAQERFVAREKRGASGAAMADAP